MPPRKKTAADIYLRVTAGAYVTYEHTKDGTGRLLIKVWTPDGEDLCGFLFDKTETVDSVIKALHRVREEILKATPIHPILRMNPPDSKLH